MWSWFGGQSAQKRREAPKQAILTLREQLEMLQKREKYLESQMAEQEAIAKKNVTTNKNAAKTALRRKKMHEKNLEQTQNQVMQLEQQVYSIETANINQETLYAMNNAGTAMKQMHAGLTLDKVDQMMDVLREQQQLADEVGRVLTETPLGEPIDEADLDEELAELEQETVDERMLKTGTVPVADHFNQLPAAANGELIKGKAKEHEDEEDEELERLQAEMALN